MKKYILTLLLFFSGSFVIAQQALLEKVISVDFRNITMYDALMQIEARAGFYFSYDNQFIKNQKKISFAVSDKPVRQILDMIFDNEYQYLVQNNKVVIRKRELPYIVVEGRLFDATDQAPVAYASVYIPELQIGTMSDEQGQFSLRMPQSANMQLTINRISYYDTILPIDSKNNKALNVPLVPRIMEESEVRMVYVQKHWLARRLIGTRQKLSSVNLKNYFYRQKFQLGLLPGIATKNVLKGQQENNLSFNVLGGYAAQVDALEIGGLFNIVQKHVRSLQIGGLANIVGGSVSGVQIGGLYNYAGDTVSGIQIGGLANADKSAVSGVQIAGWYNETQAFTGLQIAGIANNAHSVKKGMQLSGLVNRTSVFQKGLQLSGLVNVTITMTQGTQVAGLVNRAKKINGFQLGVVNLADTLRGIAIGPINYHRNGKHALSVSAQENGQVNLSYKSGNRALYNILQVGWVQAGDPGGYYLFGYGLGSEWRLKRKIKMAAELVSLFYTTAKEFNTDYDNVCFQPLLVYQASPRLQLFTGPRLQYQLTGNNEGRNLYTGFRRNMITLNENSRKPLSLGWTIGMNLF
ncbi:STN and carboxypeptidase regulatory-like domain-containing protein [Niabella drilacis]|uniref:CarboxypepD_reg-like domain-containing protein n=1 Tax=Niabella drilacis (strain DSM 25811 / CCM 8410 / CCUG 62505 / LMG 26954 / E90) TaxID=1285928 RepID=A0A1G6V6E1_NIADE|nr:STN and carboxypeptidase regulatory-like domain-containing protein [Niabella drilacis]SDD49240.1 CarboxypepD_reg-like domain-containing protein [Niabella drilacis]